MADYTLSAVLGADISDFQAKMAAAMERLEAIGTKAEGIGNKGSSGFSSFGDSAGDLVGKLLPVVGVVEGIMKAIEIGVEAFKDYGEHFKSITDLGVALKANGTNNYQEATKSIEDFAEAMQESTGINKEQTLSLAAQAASMGVSADRINETVEIQEGLSKALGGQEVPLKAIIAAQEGHYQMLSRSIPALKDVKNAQEAYSIIVAKSKVGIQELTAEQEGGLGPINKLQNAWKNIEEKLGEALSKAINPMIEKFTQWLPVIEDVGKLVVDVTKVAIVPLIDSLKILISAAEGVANVFKGKFKEAFNNLKDIKKDAKDIGTTFYNVGADVVDAFNDGVKVASADKPAEIAPPEIKSGGVKEASKGPVDVTEKFKELNTIIKEGYQAMEMFGKSRPEALKKELSEIEASMTKIEDLGDKATKKDIEAYNELSKALVNVKRDLDTIDATNDSKGGDGNLLKMMDALQKVSDISDQAKAHMTAFDETPLTALKTEATELRKAMDEAFKAGDTTGRDIYKQKLDGVTAAIAKQEQAQKQMEEQVNKSANTMAAAATKIGDTLGSAIGGMIEGKKFDMKAAFMGLLSDLASALGGFIKAKGQMLMKAGIADIIAGNMLVASSAGLNPLGYQQISQGTGEEISGAALIGAGSLVGAIKMASGGIVSGSSFVNVGEYPGAAHNPEVIAPLDKLRGMIGNTSSQHHTFEISGDKLVSILQRVDNNNSFSLGG